MKFKGIIHWPVLAGLGMALLLVSCASKLPQNVQKEIHVCSAGKCEPAIQKYTAVQLLNNFQQLLKMNEEESMPICDADPKTHTCKSNMVCYFVLGGIIPANGCARSLTFSEIKINESTAQKINMKTSIPLTFIKTQVHCATATSTLSIESTNEISITTQSYYCNWMVVGNMAAKFSFAVDSIDLDNGQIGGYWKHSVTGTGNGSGSGYAILKFPKNIQWK